MPRHYAPISENKEWTWRTNPRTCDRMFERLKVFAQFEGKKYNLQTKKQYSQLVNFNTQERGEDVGAQARQDKSTFEMFGLAYVDEDDKIVITKVGKMFLDEENADLWQHLFIKQLAKFQVPNYTQGTQRYADFHIFPLKLILDLIAKLDYLNYYEIGLVCFNTLKNSEEDLRKAVTLIKKYRSLLPSGEKRENSERVFKQLYRETWGYSPRSALDKSRPFSVFLEYTGLFSLSGRGNFTKIRVRDFFKKQAEEIRNFEFEFDDEYKSISFFKKLGDPSHPQLPFEIPTKLKEIILDKTQHLEIEKVDISKIKATTNLAELQEIDVRVDNILLKQQKQKYRAVISKTTEERTAIVEELSIIDQDPNSINLPSLKLENSVWKSLIALDGATHEVKENFKLNPDLSIKNYAGGQGNTPEIEFYNQHYIFAVEVTLLRGTAQHSAEAMSVLDHVHKFIKVKMGKKLSKPEIESLKSSFVKPNDSRKIIGVFVAREVDERVIRQFYLSGKSPVLGDEVPVVPFNLNEYVQIVAHCYEKGIPALEFEKLIEKLAGNIKETEDYEQWKRKNKAEISSFLS